MFKNVKEIVRRVGYFSN